MDFKAFFNASCALAKKIYEKPCVKRALRTFLQTASGYVAVHIVTTDLTADSAVRGLIISALAAGLAAAMNINAKDENKESEENEKDRY